MDWTLFWAVVGAVAALLAAIGSGWQILRDEQLAPKQGLQFKFINANTVQNGELRVGVHARVMGGRDLYEATARIWGPGIIDAKTEPESRPHMTCDSVPLEFTVHLGPSVKSAVFVGVTWMSTNHLRRPRLHAERIDIAGQRYQHWRWYRSPRWVRSVLRRPGDGRWATRKRPLSRSIPLE